VIPHGRSGFSYAPGKIRTCDLSLRRRRGAKGDITVQLRTIGQNVWANQVEEAGRLARPAVTVGRRAISDNVPRMPFHVRVSTDELFESLLGRRNDWRVRELRGYGYTRRDEMLESQVRGRG
jgi:hypothetical protein